MITKRLKFRLSARKKEYKFITSPRGPHKASNSIPLLSVIRDILGFARDAREARKLVKSGKVYVDKRMVKDYKHGVGIMDVVTIAGKSWRAVPNKGKISFKEISDKESELKLCKVIGKRKNNGNKIQISLHDGRNIILKEGVNVKPMDSVLIHIPDQKIIDVVQMKKGNLSLIVNGKESGNIFKIDKIERFPTRRVWTMEKKERALKSIIVIGSDKPVIDLGEIK